MKEKKYTTYVVHPLQVNIFPYIDIYIYVRNSFMLLPLTPPPTLTLTKVLCRVVVELLSSCCRVVVSIYVLVNGLGKWGTILLGNVGGGRLWVRCSDPKKRPLSGPR